MPQYSVRAALFLVLLTCFFGSSAWSAPQAPADGFVGVCSAIVYDLDNDAILFEQNADERIQPASLTKVMSMFLALDFIRDGNARMNSPVAISQQAANTGGSRMGLRQNETVPLGELLLGMAVSSGNDASRATAEYVGGSLESFVKMMNVKAALLGMRDSAFANPHGLPAAGQYTTARDMLALARAYLKAHPGALAMHNTRTLEHGGYKSWNKNPLLGQYPGADGLKTGWIRASGYNLIFTARRGAKRLLAVIMGAPDACTRGAEACRLLDAGFLVCENNAVSVAAALDDMPVDMARIDPRKTAREAGLLKPKKAAGRHLARKKPGYSLPGLRQPAHKSQASKSTGRSVGKKTAYSTKNRQNRKEHAERRSGRGARRS